MSNRLFGFSWDWLNQRQQHVIEYLVEENRILREQIGNRRLRSSWSLKLLEKPMTGNLVAS